MQLSITVPACLIGPLSTLPPNPALSQKGGAQWDSQWQFFLLLHSCKQSNTQLNPPDRISCWTWSTRSCCSMLKEFWRILVCDLLMSIQFMDALFNVAFKGNFFHLQKNASNFSIRICVRGRCISWLMSLDVEITVWILDVCLLKGKIELCLSFHKNTRKLFRLSNSLLSSNFLGCCDG